jgi:BlaI family transcriptional regulator, penicillinase repressor
MKRAGPRKLLTDVELELMTSLWRLGGGTVHDVLATLPRGRKLAYTSVSTVLRILVQKGALLVKQGGRGHVYVPKLSKEAYETASLKHMVHRVFDGAPAALVRRLLETEDVDERELEAIRALLKGRR